MLPGESKATVKVRKPSKTQVLPGQSQAAVKGIKQQADFLQDEIKRSKG